MLLLLLALAGCGSGGSGSTGSSGSGSSGAGYVDWPMFGRLPARTHYLPDDKRALDPPLKQAWSVNTHALIEFPPAIHDGVAYVINKYGNGKAVRLRDRKVLWELNVAGLLPRRRLRGLPHRQPRRRRRQDRQEAVGAAPERAPRILAARG
jgi:hypothetical protein